MAGLRLLREGLTVSSIRTFESVKAFYRDIGTDGTTLELWHDIEWQTPRKK